MALRAKGTSTGVRITGLNFVWNEVGYRRMQRQASIMGYMKGRAEAIEAEMRRLTSGPTRSADDYRKHSRYSNAYNIGTSRSHDLKESITTEESAIGARDTPYSFNIGPHNYNPPANAGADAEDLIKYTRFGTNRGIQPRDFIKDAVRNSIGIDLE